MIVKGIVGEATFLALIVLSIVVFGLIFFDGTLERLTAGKLLDIKFKKLKETEESVKQLASHVLELVEAASAESILTEAYDEERYEKAVQNLKTLIG